MDTPRDPSGPATFAEFAEVTERSLSLHRRGQGEEALRLAGEAQKALGRIEPPPTAEGAEALNSLGMVLSEHAYTSGAQAILARGLALAEALRPADDVITENLLNNLAQVEARLGHPERATALMERVIPTREARAPGSVELALALDNLGGLYVMQGDLARGEALLRRALEIFREKLGPFDTHLGTCLGNLSLVYSRRRDLDRAEAYRLRAFDIHARSGGLEHGETLLDLRQLIALAQARGDQARADQLLARLLSIGGSTPRREHRFLAEMFDDLARKSFGDFRLDVAERTGARAVELLEALEGPAAHATLKAVYLLANIQRATNDTASAERNLRRALDGFDALGARDDALPVMVDLAKIYLDRGAHDVAEKILSAAVDRLRLSAAKDPGPLASALGNLGLTHYQAGNHDLADHRYLEALALLQEAPDHPDRAWLLHNRAQLQYHLGRYRESRTLYDLAKALWARQEGPDHPFVATTNENLALACWAEGSHDLALAAFSEGAAARERGMRRIIAVGSERKRLAYARSMQTDLAKVVSFNLAIPPREDVARLAAQLTLQRKARVLDALAGTFAVVREETDDGARDLVDRLQSVRSELAAILAPAPMGRRAQPNRDRVAHLRDQEEQLEAKLSYRGALLDPDLAPVTLESVQAALPPDSALIEYFRLRPFRPQRQGNWDNWADERYTCFVLRPEGPPVWFDLGPAAATDEPVDALRRLLRNRSSTPGEIRTHAAAIHARLIAPIALAFKGARRLLIAPDGKLALLPLTILSGDDGTSLSNHATVSYLATGRDLLFLPSSEPRSSAITVFAAPDFDAGDSPALPRVPAAFKPLPETEGEARDIEALLEGVQLFTAAAATPDALRKVQHPAVLHVATHGFFAPTDDVEIKQTLDILPFDLPAMLVQTVAAPAPNAMFFTGLALAGVNRRAPGTGTGILTAQEMAGMDLRGTQLVVLSACETGLGTVKTGEEFTGLRRALSIAGAATQVTSLWRVDDLATRTLMRHFYGNLLDGRPRAEALALAQERIARDPEHPEWAHPFYWAAFVLAGAWGPMNAHLVPRNTPARPEGSRP